MRSPADVTAYLASRFDRDYPDWARGAGTWPLRVPLHPPEPPRRSADPVACHAWAGEWDRYDGPGHVKTAPLRFPTGTHPMPRALILDRPGDVAAATPATAAAWRQCGQRLTSLQAAFPRARFDRIIRRLAEMNEAEFRRLEATAGWLRDNPASGMLLRQLPIEGIGTKWLMAHAGLVLPLLGAPEDPGDQEDREDDGDDDAPASLRRRLHERLGLRLPPALVQVTVLDPAIRAGIGGMRHLAASVEDLSTWDARPSTVVILENKETAYAIAGDHPGTVVFHGHGFSVLNYARIGWVRTASAVIYWGDIDGPGLEFVSNLRGHGIPVRTVLTDTATLDAYRHLAIKGAPPVRRELPHLTPAERDLHARLAVHHAAVGTGLLLEQERIPWAHAWPHLAAAIGTTGGQAAPASLRSDVAAERKLPLGRPRGPAGVWADVAGRGPTGRDGPAGGSPGAGAERAHSRPAAQSSSPPGRRAGNRACPGLRRCTWCWSGPASRPRTSAARVPGRVPGRDLAGCRAAGSGGPRQGNDFRAGAGREPAARPPAT